MGIKFIHCACFGFLLIFLRYIKAEEIFVDAPHSFTSENYPNQYPSNYNETWCFVTSGDSRLLLTFDDIQTERFFDFITVWESTTASSDTLLLRWMGRANGNPPRVLSSGNNLCLSLQTDSLANFKGFSGQVERIDNSFNDDCSDGFDCGNGVCLRKYDRCNGFVNCGNGADEMCTRTIKVISEETFTSMNNADDGGYVNNHHFTWYFMTNSNMELVLEFSKIDLEEGGFDFISVGEGEDTSRNLRLTWHGNANDSTPVSVRSSMPSMWVQFQSDESTNGLGFEATVKSIESNQVVTCNGFNCSNIVCIPERAAQDPFQYCWDGSDFDEERTIQSLCKSDEKFCFDGGSCFSEEERCDRITDCSNDFDEIDCKISVDVKDRWIRKFRNFNQTIRYNNTKPGTHLLINLIFLWTEGRNVEVNLALSENDLDSRPLLQKNGILDEYVLTPQSQADILWLKFNVKGALAISVNSVNEEPTQSSCPDNIFFTDGDEPAKWSSPSCNDREDGRLESKCFPPSGENFNSRDNQVTCKCTDSLNSTTSCNFTVNMIAPEVTEEVQVVPLVIGLAVVAVLIVLFVSFFVTSRMGKRRPIGRTPSEGSESQPIAEDTFELGPPGHSNPMDRQTYEETDIRDRQSTGPYYHSISENPRGSPAPPNRAVAGARGAETRNPYSRGVYSVDNIQSTPSPPERRPQPSESPQYSTNITYS